MPQKSPKRHDTHLVPPLSRANAVVMYQEDQVTGHDSSLTPAQLQTKPHEALDRYQAWADQSPQVARAAQLHQQANSPASQTPLQLRKGTVPPYPALRNRPKLFRVDGGLLRMEGDEENRRQMIWDHLNGVYTRSVDRGRRYWGLLQSRIEEYQTDQAGTIQEMQTVRADYDRRYQAYYETDVSRRGGGVRTFGKEDPADRPNKKQNQYSNTVDLTSGTISADWIFAGLDPARESDKDHKGEEGYQPKGLNASEILWRQYFEVAKRQYWIRKNTRAKAAMQHLNRIRQHDVTNSDSLQVGFMALPDGNYYQAAHTWRPSDGDDFMAVLGTQNCGNAAFLLRDHMDEIGGKTIQHIRATGEADDRLNDVNLEIEFGPLPAMNPEEALDLEADIEAAHETSAVLLSELSH